MDFSDDRRSYTQHDVTQAQQLGAVTATIKEYSSQLEAIFKDLHFIKNELVKVSTIPTVLEEIRLLKHEQESIKLALAPLQSTYSTTSKITLAIFTGIAIQVIWFILKR